MWVFHLEAICAFLWLSFQMRLICNQYVNEKLSSGRYVEEKFLFVTSGTAGKTAVWQFISLCQYCSIIDMFSDLIDYKNNRQAVKTWTHIMLLYIWSGLCSDLNLPRETVRASHTSQDLAIFKPTFGFLLCAYHSKSCWSHHRTQHKDIVPESGASKEHQGQTLYF